MSLNRRVLVYMVLMMTGNVGYVRGALKGVFGGPRHGV